MKRVLTIVTLCVTIAFVGFAETTYLDMWAADEWEELSYAHKCKVVQGWLLGALSVGRYIGSDDLLLEVITLPVGEIVFRVSQIYRSEDFRSIPIYAVILLLNEVPMPENNYPSQPDERVDDSPFILKKLDEVTTSRSFLLCGLSKSGRTTFAASFPRPLFIDADKGLASIKSIVENDYQIVELPFGGQTHQILEDLYRALKAKTAPFDKWYPKTVVIDSLSAVSLHMEQEMRSFELDAERKMKRGDGLFLADYNFIQTRLKRAVTLYKQLGVYLLCTADLQRDKDDVTGTITEMPNLTGKALSGHIPHWFDEVYYHFYDAVKEKYVIQTIPSQKFSYGGTKTQPRMPKYVADPSFDKLKEFYV